MAQTHAIFAVPQHKHGEGNEEWRGAVEDKQTPRNMGTTNSEEVSSGSVGLVNECVFKKLHI